jgi:transposase
MAWRSGQSYSAELRERVLTAVDGGLPAKTVAERFGVSLSFIDKALTRRRVSGETTARAQRDQQAFKLAAHHEAIRAEVVLRPDLTLEELRGWLAETHEVEASLGLMHNTLIRIGLTLKKSPGGRPCGAVGTPQPHGEEQDRPDIAEQRIAWRAEQAALSVGRLIFIDETGASTKLARRHGRCRRGERLDAALPPSRACWPCSLRESADWPPGQSWTLEDDDLHRRPDKSSIYSTLRPRRCHGWADVQSLDRANAGSQADARRRRH